MSGAVMTAMTYEIPMPPSVNQWKTPHKGRLILTKTYREWQSAADTMFLSQRARPFGKPAIITIEVPERRKGSDIDNRVKSVLDALTRAGVIEDDSGEHVREVRARWIGRGETPRVTLEAADMARQARETGVPDRGAT